MYLLYSSHSQKSFVSSLSSRERQFLSYMHKKKRIYYKIRGMERAKTQSSIVCKYKIKYDTCLRMQRITFLCLHW